MESASPNSDTPKPCSGGCGFFGSAPLNYYCSVCFKKTHGEEEYKRLMNVPEEKPASLAKVVEESAPEPMAVEPQAAASPQQEEVAKVDATPGAADSGEPQKPKPTRCFSCKKKVGLTGFTCRCGNTFCGVHRYSDKHECTFDYKTAGREQLEKANPNITAAKVEKI